MSPRMGRPTENPKNVRLEIRLTEDEANVLQQCANELKTTKTNVINKGIQLVKAELSKKK